jgi:hypothetical protein
MSLLIGYLGHVWLPSTQYHTFVLAQQVWQVTVLCQSNWSPDLCFKSWLASVSCVYDMWSKRLRKSGTTQIQTICLIENISWTHEYITQTPRVVWQIRIEHHQAKHHKLHLCSILGDIITESMISMRLVSDGAFLGCAHKSHVFGLFVRGSRS